MKGMKRFSGMAALLTVGVLTVGVVESYGMDVIFGSDIGRSFTLSTYRYDEYGDIYLTPELKMCMTCVIGFNLAGNFSLFAEAQVQRYEEIYHPFSGGPSAISHGRSFAYVGGSLEYRFFRNVRRTWNPYLRFGVYGLLYLNLFGAGAPEYPRTASVGISAGTRIRLAGSLYLDPRLLYMSGSSSVALLVGLDLIIGKSGGRAGGPGMLNATLLGALVHNLTN